MSRFSAEGGSFGNLDGGCPVLRLDHVGTFVRAVFKRPYVTRATVPVSFGTFGAEFSEVSQHSTYSLQEWCVGLVDRLLTEHPHGQL